MEEKQARTVDPTIVSQRALVASGDEKRQREWIQGPWQENGLGKADGLASLRSLGLGERGQTMGTDQSDQGMGTGVREQKARGVVRSGAGFWAGVGAAGSRTAFRRDDIWAITGQILIQNDQK